MILQRLCNLGKGCGKNYIDIESNTDYFINIDNNFEETDDVKVS